MSTEKIKLALDKARDCEGFSIVGPKSDVVIRKAEELLGFPLSAQTKYFYKTVGYMEFFGHEFYGIIKDDFSGQPTGCSVEYALQERDATNLPKAWLPILFMDDGEMAYLDYNILNNEGEPRVIAALYNGEEYLVTEVLASNLGDFVLELVIRQLENQ